MSGNTFGKIFTLTTFGESHGTAIGCVVDGCPPGMNLSEADIQPDLDRRKPGSSRFTTQRRESDQIELLSGVFEGKTTGAPIGMLIRNTEQTISRLFEDRRSISTRSCGLHICAKVRNPRLPRRWPFVSTRNGDARRCRSDC